MTAITWPVFDGSYLSIEQASDRYEIPVATLLRRLNSGELSGVKVAGRWCISEAALDEHGYVPLAHRPAQDLTTRQMREVINQLSLELVQQRNRADKLETRLGAVTEELARVRAALENRTFNSFAARAANALEST